MSTVNFITGLPGAGKTLRALVMADEFTSQGRQVYVANVRGLTRTDWKECDPRNWMDLPDGSVVFVDEVQDFFPMRGPRDPMPEAVQRLDKHRHRGFTFIFTCQYPKQVDFALRGFVSRHIHLRRMFGWPKSVAMELNRVMDIDDKGDIAKSMKSQWAFPKRVYGWYESATEHNIKAKVPARVLAFPVLVLGVAGLAWFGVKQIGGMGEKLGVAVNPGQAKPLGSQAVSQGMSRPVPVSATQAPGLPAARGVVDYASVEAYRPRVAGLQHTAPRYDEIAKPVRAPYPAVCAISASKGCKCWTQQATPYTTSDGLCRQIVANGFFMDFEPDSIDRRESRGSEPIERRRSVERGEALPSPQLVKIDAPAPRQTVASRLAGGGR